MRKTLWLARGSPHGRTEKDDGGAPGRRHEISISLTTTISSFGNCNRFQEKHMSIEMIEVEEFHSGTQIKVIGVGGGGGNASST
jgi:hypothetical protein